MELAGNRGNLEQKIAWSLDRLSPEDMQRVAEDFAQIRFGDRFPHFDGRALSFEGRSRPGWPDAWVVRNGQEHGVEATVAKTKKDVIEHLRKDLAKAQQHADLRSLLFVSGHSEVQISPDELTSWRQRFINEGQLEWVELIFASRLVSELAQPDFVRTREGILGISEHPKLFERMRPSMRPDGRRLPSKFIPTEEDYRLGRVHCPSAAVQVRAQLKKHGCALVRGVGASGKSVLAWLLAQEAADHGQAVYWLDLASFSDASASPSVTNDLRSDLERFGYQQALFILDNVHLDEALARSVLDDWRVLAPRFQPRLLILGRELQTSRGSPLHGAENIDAIPLKALQPEVLGVYRRLAWSKCGDQPPPEPSAAVIDQWVATFGGDPKNPETTTDLIAFSAAVMRRLDWLLRGEWRLSEEDAIEEIRDVYLNPLTDDELANIYRLSVMQQLEMGLDEKALKNQRVGFRKSTNQLGLVFRYEVGRGTKYVRYRLAHAALSRLILKAAYEAIVPAAELLSVAQDYPFAGVALVIKLVNHGKRSEASKLADEMLVSSDWIIQLGSLHYITTFLIKSQLAGVTLPNSLHESLCSLKARSSLTSYALQSPLFQLAEDLRQLSIPGLRRVAEEIVRELSLSSNRNAIAKRASHEPLLSLKTFLEHARESEQLSSMFENLANDLARQDHLAPLAEQALGSPVQVLGDFLSYTARAPKLMPVYKGLTAILSQPDSLIQLAHLLEVQQLSHVLFALNSNVAAEIWQAAFELIDLERWNQTRLQERRPNIDAFARFQKLAFKRHRIELARAPALRLLRGSDSNDWHRRGVHLGQLSHVVRLAKEATFDELDQFLNHIATPEWLDALFNSEQTGGLAGSLQAFADNLLPKHWELFDRDSLKQRIVRELNDQSRPQSIDDAFSLLGAAAAMNIRTQLHLINWPSENFLAKLVEKRAPIPDRINIGPLQIQFWLGLREMARVRANQICLPAEQSEQILVLWRAKRDNQVDFQLPPHAQSLNASVIAWLERCQAEGWRLQVP